MMRLFRNIRNPSIEMTDYETFSIMLTARGFMPEVESLPNGGRLIKMNGAEFVFTAGGTLTEAGPPGADPARWEEGFRRIASYCVGPRQKFEINDIVVNLQRILRDAAGMPPGCSCCPTLSRGDRCDKKSEGDEIRCSGPLAFLNETDPRVIAYRKRMRGE